MIENTFEDFKDWLERISRNSPPPQTIIAYNFGLLETTDGYETYLIGSSKYNPEDDDWACEPDYIPMEKYFILPENLTNGKDWRGVQCEVISLVKQFLESEKSSVSFLVNASAVTVGFDDGDLERVK